jgi:hypothetical protein
LEQEMSDEPTSESADDEETSTGEKEAAETCPQPEHAWKALSLVNEWIRHAETKAAAVLAAAGVTGGVLYNLVKSQQHPSCVINVLAMLCGGLVFAAGFCATATLIPRRNVSGGAENFSNLLFYSHVALAYRNDEPTYAQVLAALTSNPHDLTRHLANQVHANSVVADRKFVWATRGIIVLVAALATLGALAVVIGAKA